MGPVCVDAARLRGLIGSRLLAEEPEGEPWRDCPAGEPTQLDTRGGEKVAGLLPPQPSSGQQLKLLFDFCFLSFPQVVGATMSLCVPPSPISILVPSRGHYSRGRRRSHRGPGQGGMSSFTVTELSVASHGGVFVSGTLFLGQALSSLHH